MKKILYVCPSSGVGGAETFLAQTQSFVTKEEFENWSKMRANYKSRTMKEVMNDYHIRKTNPGYGRSLCGRIYTS